MTRRGISTAVIGALILGVLALSAPVGAAPVLAPLTCRATEAPTPSGSVSIQILPFLPPLVVPVPELGQPIADALATTELPLPLPVDLEATAEIEPGGTIDYATALSLDLGTGVTDAMDAVRQALTDAGYPELAETLQIEAVLEDLTIAFPHPEGTAATGTPTATGATAAHVGDALVVGVDDVTISTETGVEPLDAEVAWSVLDEGTTPPATITQTLGTIDYGFDFEVRGTVPTELIEPFLPELPITLPPELPLTAGASGPWQCTPDDPTQALAETQVVGDEPPTEVARLRVTTVPALPAPIIVDGLPRDNWGLNWMAIDPGEHEVCFGAVPGFTPPPCETVMVDDGATTTVEGVFAARGTLRAITSPPVAATITIDGHPANDWGVWSDLEPGTYDVCFGAVADLAPPPCEEIEIQAGQTTTVTGEYTADPGAPGPEGHGYLRATTDPAVASRILVDGHPADTWGLTWVKLAPGDHEVCFEEVLGTSGPDCTTVPITAGDVSVVVGSFDVHGLLQVTTDPAVAATISIDGVATNAWGVWTSREPGTYEVCFGPVEGTIAPPCQDVVVTSGATSSVVGSYT